MALGSLALRDLPLDFLLWFEFIGPESVILSPRDRIVGPT